MGILGSDFVAVTCIVAGGALGGLGWTAWEVQEAQAPPRPGCAGVAVLPRSAPEVVIRFEDGDRIVIAPPAPSGVDVRLACGTGEATVEELRARTLEARSRIGDGRGRLGSWAPPEVGVYRVPESAR